MLTAHGISKSYGVNPILQDVTFSLNPGECTGLVGPNGCGKTTLVKTLAGLELPDSGHISLSPASLRVGYLPQSFDIDPARTIAIVIEEVLGDPTRLDVQLLKYAEELSLNPEDQALQSAYDRVLSRIETHDPNQAVRQKNILAALGLEQASPQTPIRELSGGQKTRLGLALILIDNPAVLLLDEPTNHLDIEMLEWLEAWLVEYTRHPKQAALVISHDRTFLDNTVTSILDLDPLTRSVRQYPGSYTDYLDQVIAEREKQSSAYRDQVDEIRRMRQDIQSTKQQSLRVEMSTTSRQPGVRRIAKKVAKKAKSRQKKLDRFLGSDERLDKPLQGWQMKLEFGGPDHLGQDVLTLDELSLGYPEHPALAVGLRGSIRLGERVALTGPNGCGKTTLLRTIAGLLEPAAGSMRLGAGLKLGYMAQEQELLDWGLNAVETVQGLAPFNETEARSFLHFFLFSGDDALRPVEQLSFGERSRLMLATLVAQSCNFLLLDEPVNHLDIPSRERFEQALNHFRRHDPGCCA